MALAVCGLVSAAIRAHLPRFRPAALRDGLARLYGHHQFARRGPHLRPLRGQRESSDVIVVVPSNLEESTAFVFAEMQHEVSGVAGFMQACEALDVLPRRGSRHLCRGGLQVPCGAQGR